jgi:hypothetical protein
LLTVFFFMIKFTGNKWTDFKVAIGDSPQVHIPVQLKPLQTEVSPLCQKLPWLLQSHSLPKKQLLSDLFCHRFVFPVLDLCMNAVIQLVFLPPLWSGFFGWVCCF